MVEGSALGMTAGRETGIADMDGNWTEVGLKSTLL